MTRSRLTLLLALFICADLAYTTILHCHTGIDGDLAKIVVPAPEYRQVLEDPLGLQALLGGERYAAPNRFLAHWMTRAYFNHVPGWLQHWVEPVDSVYLAIGLVKTLIQALLAGMLALLIARSGRRGGRDALLALALILPLFVTTQPLHRVIGIIDLSVNYTFFYAAPLALLLLFFYPFFGAWLEGRQPRLGLLHRLLLPPAALALSLSGPLVPAVAILACPALLLYLWWEQLRQPAAAGRALPALAAIDRYTLALLLGFTSAALYSLYLGQFNEENAWASKSLAERYALLPLGLGRSLVRYWGGGLLAAFCLYNAWLLYRAATPQARGLLRLGLALALICGVYLAMLPLGGYRMYRPYIVRYDTLMPVTLCLIFFFGASSRALLTTSTPAPLISYRLPLILLLAYFLLCDLPVQRPEAANHWRPTLKRQFAYHACERRAMEELAAATADRITLQLDCPFMSWKPDPATGSVHLNNLLLQRWHILSPAQRYELRAPTGDRPRALARPRATE